MLGENLDEACRRGDWLARGLSRECVAGDSDRIQVSRKRWLLVGERGRLLQPEKHTRNEGVRPLLWCWKLLSVLVVEMLGPDAAVGGGGAVVLCRPSPALPLPTPAPPRTQHLPNIRIRPAAYAAVLTNSTAARPLTTLDVLQQRKNSPPPPPPRQPPCTSLQNLSRLRHTPSAPCCADTHDT